MGAERYYPRHLNSGTVLQAGLPTGGGVRTAPGGILLRGVVTATYVSDDANNPVGENNPVAVYCDVLAYGSSTSGSRWMFFPMCLVSQEIGGMHRGIVWKPRATTMDINTPTSGNQLDVDGVTNPADMDGDHVIVGFLDGTTSMPIVLRGIPHPSMDAGKDGAAVLGDRIKLKVEDGDPYFVKHHGVFFGVDDKGDMVVDLSRAQNGALKNDGAEPALPQDGSTGNLLVNIEQNAKRLVQLLDMSSPQSPQAVLSELMDLAGYVLDFMSQTPAWQIKASDDNVVQFANKAADATMKVGDGAKHVAIVEALKSFWSNTIKQYLDTHTHPTSTGPSGPPAQPAPSWDASIESSKIAIPDG